MTDRIDIPADEHEDLARMLHALGDEPLPGDVAARLDNVLAAQRPLVAPPRRPRFGIRLAPLLAAASVVVVVGLVYAIGRNGGTPDGQFNAATTAAAAADLATSAAAAETAGAAATAEASTVASSAASSAASGAAMEAAEAAPAAAPGAEKTTSAAETAGATEAAAQAAGAAEPAAPTPSDVSAADLFALLTTPFGPGVLDPRNDPALAPFNAAVAAFNAWQAANDLLNRTP